MCLGSNLADPLHPPENRSEGVNLIQDGTGHMNESITFFWTPFLKTER